MVDNKDKLTLYEQQFANRQRQYYEMTATTVKAQLSNVDEFHDISDVFSGDPKPYFIDSVHITGAGNEVVARRMLKDVVPIVQLWQTR